MRIIEVELKNHIHLGNIHFYPDNEINTFLGVNGSGKSYLLFLLHPGSSSDRDSTIYPIESNKKGLKRILFRKNDSIYEILHEYTPKGNKHSCKSYLNIIHSNGKKEELNPTGHNIFFKDLIEKHLNFTTAVQDVCYITNTNNGLVTATSKKRKEILESTINIPLLKRMQKNSIELTKESKVLYNSTSNEFTNIANKIDKIETAYKEIDNLENIVNSNNRLIYDKEKESSLVEDKLRQLENSPDISIMTLKLILEIWSKHSYNKDLSSFYNDMYQSKVSLDNNLKDIITLNKTISMYESIYDMIESYNVSKNDYNEIVREITQFKEKLSNKAILEYVTRDIIIEAQSILKTINFQKASIDYKELESLEKEYNNLQEKIYNYESIKKSLKSDLDIDFEMKDVNCSKCQLYTMVIYNRKFINQNLHNYDLWKEDSIHLYDKISEIKYSKDGCLKLYNIISKFLIKLQNRSFEDFLNIISNANFQFSEYFEELFENLLYYIKLKDDANTKKLTLDGMKIDQSISINDLVKLREDRNTMQKNVDKMREEFSYINQDLLDYIKSILNLNLKNINSLYDYQTLLDDLRNKISSKSKYSSQLSSIQNEISTLKNSNEEYKNKIFTIKSNIESYNRLSQDIKNKKSELDFFSLSKDILLKYIPIDLLENNLRFIEQVTNRILTENNIDLQIKIQSDETDILIPYIVREYEVEDIRLASQGEKCLLSLLINACMIHITNYGIMYLDEIDANLDEINRKKFNNIIYSILNILNVKQIFGVSHNISSNISEAKKFSLGDISELNLEGDIEKIK